MSNTPMNLLKGSVDNFKEIVRGLIKNEYVLNASKPKYNPYGGQYGYGKDTKGVKNEFLRIFEINDKDNFAFIFNNIKKDLSHVLITVSIKRGENYISRTFSFNEFKETLKNCNKTLKILKDVKALDKKSLLLTLEETFKVTEKINDTEIVKEICKKIKTEITSDKRKLTTLNKNKEKAEDQLKRSQRAVNVKIKKKKEELDYESMKEKYEALKKDFLAIGRDLKKEERELDKTFGITEQVNKLKVIEMDIQKNNNKTQKIVGEFTKPYDKRIKAMVEDELLPNKGK